MGKQGIRVPSSQARDRRAAGRHRGDQRGLCRTGRAPRRRRHRRAPPDRRAGGVCAILAPDTRAAVAESSGTTGAQAITDAGLPPPGAVRTVDVYGQWARVVTEQDTLFLAAFGDGWQVVAAGCRSRGERPYDCRVEGE
jgi:hypothetical protein